MNFAVFSKSQAEKHVRFPKFTHHVSLLDPGDSMKSRNDFKLGVNRLHLVCDDVISRTASNAPTEDQVKRLLDFGDALPGDASVAFNCQAGVSRSTAACLAVMAQKFGKGSLDNCRDLLLSIRPEACPNPVILFHADKLLGFDGALFNLGEDIAQDHMIRVLIQVPRLDFKDF